MILNQEIHNILIENKDRTYKLSETDKILADTAANIKVKETIGIPSYVHLSKNEIYDNFYQGFLGEIVLWRIFKDLLGLEYYFSIKCGDDGVDFVSKKYNDIVFDNKSSKFIFSNSNFRMISIPRIYDKTDIYTVISMENNDECVFMGHLWKSDVIEKYSRRIIKGGNAEIKGVDKKFLY